MRQTNEIKDEINMMEDGSRIGLKTQRTGLFLCKVYQREVLTLTITQNRGKSGQKRKTDSSLNLGDKDVGRTAVEFNHE